MRSTSLVAAAMALAAYPRSAHSQAAGLSAAYAMDEGSGTTISDRSGNNNTGTLTNGPTWTTGKYGGALLFRQRRLLRAARRGRGAPYDGSQLRLYVNGALAASTAVTGYYQVNTNPLWIGGNAVYGEHFQGKLDELRIYNRALTQAEIQQDMTTAIQ